MWSFDWFEELDILFVMEKNSPAGGGITSSRILGFILFQIFLMMILNSSFPWSGFPENNTLQSHELTELHKNIMLLCLYKKLYCLLIFYLVTYIIACG